MEVVTMAAAVSVLLWQVMFTCIILISLSSQLQLHITVVPVLVVSAVAITLLNISMTVIVLRVATMFVGVQGVVRIVGVASCCHRGDQSLRSYSL